MNWQLNGQYILVNEIGRPGAGPIAVSQEGTGFRTWLYPRLNHNGGEWGRNNESLNNKTSKMRYLRFVSLDLR